jgi:DNA-binding XRE family transcriptional regulator
MKSVYNKESGMKKKLHVSIKTENMLKSIADNIRIARERRSMKVTELASRIGVDRGTIIRLEKGASTVSLGLYLEVLNHLNLLEGQDVVTNPSNDVGALSEQIRKIRSEKRKKVSSLSDDVSLNF